MNTADIVRFRSKTKILDNGCIEFVGAKDKDGYGLFYVRGGKLTRAHRFAFSIAKGEIQAGILVCHTCNFRACVNDQHLYAGTAQDNADDRVAAGNSPRGDKNVSRFMPGIRRGENNGNVRLDIATVLSIRADAQTLSLSAIALKYCISWIHAKRIVSRVSWRHI
jgi:hypothetical protein